MHSKGVLLLEFIGETCHHQTIDLTRIEKGPKETVCL
jgi:hypothetical protein